MWLLLTASAAPIHPLQPVRNDDRAWAATTGGATTWDDQLTFGGALEVGLVPVPELVVVAGAAAGANAVSHDPAGFASLRVRPVHTEAASLEIGATAIVHEGPSLIAFPTAALLYTDGQASADFTLFPVSWRVRRRPPTWSDGTRLPNRSKLRDPRDDFGWQRLPASVGVSWTHRDHTVRFGVPELLSWTLPAGPLEITSSFGLGMYGALRVSASRTRSR